MKNTIIILLSIVFLMSFKQTNNERKSNNFECKELIFSSNQERADSLIMFMNKAEKSVSNERLKWEEKFFNSFPNTFKEMQELFGYDNDKGDAPLYFTENPSNKYLDKRIHSDVIGYFSELKSISNICYYEKYIKININGKWEADNIREAFGFEFRLLNDTQNSCKALIKFSDKEIKSVYNFIFDGPHPKNEYNEKLFHQLKEKISNQDKRLAKLLNVTYEQLIDKEH